VSSKKNKGMEEGVPVIGLLTVDIHCPHSRSLKDKRMTVKAIKDRLRKRFNVAVAETGYQELWQRSVLSAVTVSSERSGLESLMESMARDVEERYSDELNISTDVELIG
jgi:hypothetical protein